MDPRRRPTTGVFLAALGFLLLTHGGHLYASDSLIVHLTATRLPTLAYLAVPTALLSFGLLWIWATWRNPTPAAPVR